MNGCLGAAQHRLCDVTWGKDTVVWVELRGQLAPRMQGNWRGTRNSVVQLVREVHETSKGFTRYWLWA